MGHMGQSLKIRLLITFKEKKKNINTMNWNKKTKKEILVFHADGKNRTAMAFCTSQ